MNFEKIFEAKKFIPSSESDSTLLPFETTRTDSHCSPFTCQYHRTATDSVKTAVKQRGRLFGPRKCKQELVRVQDVVDLHRLPVCTYPFSVSDSLLTVSAALGHGNFSDAYAK